jgi:hypothetical protein
MDQFDHHFTEDEAKALLKELLPTIEELMTTRNRKAVGNGGSHATGELLGLMQRIGLLVQQIQEAGVLVKDLDRGLLDFPSEREGRIVFLCWEYGEPELAYWHDIDAGFGGRQPL